MAVVRSQAFQNARKSVGQNNYYRRKGVQLVRSKATFAPNRTFTNAQKICQTKMSAVQYLLTDGMANKWANFCNISNKKRYNASTQINKLAAGLLREIPDAYADPEKTVIENVTRIGEMFFYGFTYGSTELKPDFITIPEISESDHTAIELQLYINKDRVDLFLSNMRNKLRLRKAFSAYDIGTLLYFSRGTNLSPSRDNMYIGEPMYPEGVTESSDVVGYYEYNFIIDFTLIQAGTEDALPNMYGCIFLGNSDDANGAIPNGKAYWNSAVFQSTALSTGQRKPVRFNV